MCDNAWTELLEVLDEDEHIEGIVFGAWGNGDEPDDGKPWKLSRSEPINPPVPLDKRGIVLDADTAKDYMNGWRFMNDFGSSACYATYVWTNKQLISVTRYDGATCMNVMPRNPINCIPEFTGG